MNKYLKRLGAITLGVALSIGLGVFSSAKIAKNAKADSGKITINTTKTQVDSTGADKTITESGVTLTFSNISSVDASWIQNAKNATITSTAVPGPITSIKIYNCQTTSAKTDGGFTVYGGTSASAINTSIKEVSGLSSTASDQTINFSGEYTFFKVVNGSARVLKHSKIEINYSSSSDPIESISVSGNMSKTTYYSGESWNPDGFTVTAQRESGETSDVTDDVTWSFNPSAPALSVTSVVATATLDSLSASSTTQSVTVLRSNPIQEIYTKASEAAVDVYGYYVGFLDGTGPVIMDGEYGVVIYSKTADVSSYTEKETILHVTGSISIYNGLYEIGSPTINVASGSYDAPSAPVVYATKGGETAEYASRLTTLTGTPEVTSGSFDSAAGTADIKMNFTVGAKTVQVFYKKAAQTADADAFAAMKEAVTNSSEITVKGFTGWYNGFQVQMNGVVEAVYGYTAEDFAQDLLDQTDAICSGYDGHTNNHDALVAVWSDLASDDKYPSLPSEEKTKLTNADIHGSTIVDQAMARYDYLTGKYALNNFINGRSPSAQSVYAFDSIDSYFAPLMIIACSSCIAFVGLILIRRKRLAK